MLKMNRAVYMDKLHACWLGKNIGGTLGMPYEGSHEMHDVKGFKTPKGEPLPNDGLDLQLVWLSALERRGVANVDCNVLAGWLERRGASKKFALGVSAAHSRTLGRGQHLL